MLSKLLQRSICMKDQIFPIVYSTRRIEAGKVCLHLALLIALMLFGPAPIIAQSAPVRIISFFKMIPASGGPGTIVRLVSGDAVYDQSVVLKIGVPQAGGVVQSVGEPLATVEPDVKGNWTTNIVIPSSLPSGDSVTPHNLLITVSYASGRYLGFQQFDFIPAPLPGTGQGTGLNLWLISLSLLASIIITAGLLVRLAWPEPRRK